MKKIIVAGLSAMLVLSACGGDEEPEMGTADELDEAMEVAAGEEGESLIDAERYPEVIATVNGEDIQREEFVLNLEQQAAMLQSQGMSLQGEEGEEFLEMLEMQLLDQLVNEEILRQSAEEASLEASPEEIDAEIELLMEDAQITEEQLEELLEQQNSNMDELRDDIRPLVVRNKYLDSQMELTAITDEEIQEAYDAYVEAMEAQGAEVGSLEEERDTIEMELENQQRQQQISEIVQRLREDSEVNIHI